MNKLETPRANRLHIGIFGRRNSGKSSLINAITHQEAALVSDIAGTTTDPVYQPMELHGIGPCVFIDTAGFDDTGELGAMRVRQTMRALAKTDVALLVCTDGEIDEELRWNDRLKAAGIPVVWMLNKADLLPDSVVTARAIERKCGRLPLIVSAVTGEGIDAVRHAIAGQLPDETMRRGIIGDLAGDGDTVLLVMPQDLQAPKGRLILPQVQTLRELLDKRCLVMCCTTDRLGDMLQAMAAPPRLIITDSQVFKTVYGLKPAESRLTSFSVLFAQYKGDIDYFIEGAEAIGRLTEHARVLIAEACTHAPLAEDIGREKIPALLRKRVGQGLQVEGVSGTDFPDDLSPYDLVIHCGACMFNRKYVLHRIAQAKAQQVPMTNYGVAIAWLAGILDRLTIAR